MVLVSIKKHLKKTLFCLALVCAFGMFTGNASAKKSRSVTLIMDAESIAWFEEVSRPLLKNAGIDPKDIKFHIIKDDEVNAFVTPDKRIFFNSGLILRAETPEEVVGVLAHEIGHIQGRHLEKLQASNTSRNIPMILGGILGVGAAMYGNAQAATALLVGGQAASASSFLKYSRSHERHADLQAIQLLEESNYDATGLLSFFEKLRNERLLYSKLPPAYLSSHPLPADRLDGLRLMYSQDNDNTNAVAKNGVVKVKSLDKIKKLDLQRFKNIQAKLFAFSNQTGTTLRKYNLSDDEDAIYARAISYAIQGKLLDSISQTEKLLKVNPDNPYYYELLAQIYLDKSDLKSAEGNYIKALKLVEKQDGNSGLLRSQYANLLIAMDKNHEAVQQLTLVNQAIPNWENVFYNLGVAYGKLGLMAKSHIALGNQALLKRNIKDLKIHIKLAEKNISKASEPTKKQLGILKEHLKTLSK